MDLTSSGPFWLIRDGAGDAAAPLPGDRDCDVVVIGAGITGALIADAVSATGVSVIALDRRNPGSGSTSASTALLQYELDEPLSELMEKVGRARATDAYGAALYGVRAIARLAGELGEDVGFRKRPSLYYASRSSDARVLRRECVARRKAKLPCRILDRKELAKVVDLEAPLALWSTAGGEVDPLLLTRALLQRCGTRRGFELYGDTDVQIALPNRTAVEVHTNRGVVRAKKVIVAAGYEAEKFLPKRVAKLHSTYAIATEPVKNFAGWRKRCLIWESARPYLYIRTTSDDRIIVGGEDDPFRNPEERDARVPKKAQTLLKKARRLFPKIEMQLACGWAGTFGDTKDSLPFIGVHPDLDPRVLFALAYGANGMPFSAVAAEVMRDAVRGKSHRYLDAFGFDR